ncbi:hypothetical protein [Streptomyces sp. NPDC060027]|uniref:hypothetical protein n=1 Tax=Streptomyces sp. NPDC060027 TaxID=3347040 RepID=UPI0036C29256
MPVEAHPFFGSGDLPAVLAWNEVRKSTWNALVVTPLVQIGMVAVTGLLNLRLPRVIG